MRFNMPLRLSVYLAQDMSARYSSSYLRRILCGRRKHHLRRPSLPSVRLSLQRDEQTRCTSPTADLGIMCKRDICRNIWRSNSSDGNSIVCKSARSPTRATNTWSVTPMGFQPKLFFTPLVLTYLQKTSPEYSTEE